MRKNRLIWYGNELTYQSTPGLGIGKTSFVNYGMTNRSSWCCLGKKAKT